MGGLVTIRLLCIGIAWTRSPNFSPPVERRTQTISSRACGPSFFVINTGVVLFLNLLKRVDSISWKREEGRARNECNTICTVLGMLKTDRLRGRLRRNLVSFERIWGWPFVHSVFVTSMFPVCNTHYCRTNVYKISVLFLRLRRFASTRRPGGSGSSAFWTYWTLSTHTNSRLRYRSCNAPQPRC